MPLSYPVDLNAKYVSYNTVTLEVSNAKSWPRADGMAISGLDAEINMLMLTKGVMPVYDSATHEITREQVIDVPASEYRTEYTAAPLSAEDLAEVQEDSEIDAERVQAIAVYQDLKDGAGNSNQRIARVEKVAAHLLRRMYRP